LREYWGSYWAIIGFVAFSMIVGVRSLEPWILLVGCAIAASGGFITTMRISSPFAKVVVLVPLALAGGVLSFVQDLNNQGAYTIGIVAVLALAAVAFAQRPSVTLTVGLLFGVAAFQVLSGTHGLAWIFLTAALLPVVLDVIASTSDRLPAAIGFAGAAAMAGGGALLISLSGFGLAPLGAFALAIVGLVAALRRDAGPGTRLGAIALLSVATWQIGRLVDVQGIDWKDWGGLHLNLVVAAATTALAFPVGLLLALGRRSSLPVLRWMCTTYIEVIRGVPLITLLFMAQLFVGFFLNGSNLPLPTKSIIVFTMFSSAYIAEIVRGGLQSVAKGQTEAGQAMGMSPAAITRLLVLPQALKAVIPAMVGQFISLFKDTSLLTFIGVVEFLGVREIVHSQAEFRGFGIAETLVFVAFGYWAFSFTMSRESQRLERRLDTGNR
jgi:general L-amino acid transport system permease protein